MRTFDLIRDEDVTGISGTGRIAQGVVFDDGSAVLRWLTAHRSTTVFPSLETMEAIHGHGGRTRVAFHDNQPVLVELAKPHLQLGNEGEFADGSQYDQGGAGPADLRAHIAYDRLGKIEAPTGWAACVCWFVHGAVSLTLKSPSRYLGAEEHEYNGARYTSEHYERQEVTLEINSDTVRQVNERCGRPGSIVRVAGVEYTARYGTYWTMK